MLRLLLISLLLVSCRGNPMQNAISQAVSYQEQNQQESPDTLLAGIQNKISYAFIQSIMAKNKSPLQKIGNELELLSKENKQNLITYWRAYLQFYTSIFYFKNGNKKVAEKEIDKGIDWLKKMKHKNSEDYALLALLQGFGIQFKGIKAIFIAGDIKENAKTAIALDSTNLRAYYVYASNDFYTPEKYGGGKEAEKYLLKAISLPVQKIKNEYLPSWGKEESYEMLIKLYIKREKWDLAKRYFQEGIKEYPESYIINQLAAKLVGK